jgi:uncharacterized repeat protein (TIGR03803 family)
VLLPSHVAHSGTRTVQYRPFLKTPRRSRKASYTVESFQSLHHFITHRRHFIAVEPREFSSRQVVAMPAKQLIVPPTQGSGSSVCFGRDVQLRSRIDAKTTLWFLCVVLMFCLNAITVLPAQTLTTLTSFNRTDGSGPWSLVQGIDGNFYGTTQIGGATNAHCSGGCGTVFKITSTGTLTTLYSFCAQGGNSCPDGDSPYAGLVQGADGNLYGTTNQGGADCIDNGGCGTFFEITPAGTLTTLYSFTGGANGSAPFGGLVQAANGSFYGTTALGGAHNAGTVFTITPAGALTTLYSFCTHVAAPTASTLMSD